MKFKSYMVAAALAATVSSNALAAIDLDANSGSITVANETFTTADYQTTPTADTLEVTNAANILDMTVEQGFIVQDNSEGYVRVEFTNAYITGAGVAITSAGVATLTQAASGADGDQLVIYLIDNQGGADDGATTVLTIAPPTLDILPGTVATVTYSFHSDEVDAVNNTNALKTVTRTITEFADASTGQISTDATCTATVASEFLGFAVTGGGISATLCELGTIGATSVLNGSITYYEPDGTAVVAADIVDNDQLLTITGDVSFGTFELDSDANCNNDATNETAVVADAGGTFGTVANFDITAADYNLCLIVSGTESILKSTYTANVADDGITDDTGAIEYDTIAVELPFVTVFADYNQRIYLINNSNADASYTTSFETEDGVTATAGTGATGTVDANSVLMIKAVDFVSFDVGNRGAAIIEVELREEDFQGTTQIVNTANGGTTDTFNLTEN